MAGSSIARRGTKRLVIGNWKGYVQTPAAALRLAGAIRRKARAFSGVEVAVAPPAPFIYAVAEALKSSPVLVAAQSVSPREGDRQTGEVSAATLKAAGATMAIVGHSERRAAGETGEQIALEAKFAIAEGLRVVVCVGEQAREASGGHFGVLEAQLHESLRHIKNFGGRLVVAYEPVWAIGKTAAEAMQPADLQETVIFIRKTLADILPRAVALKVPVLYGGSVEKENAEALLKEGGVAGFLVGHASVDAASFIEILTLCSRK